MSQICEKIKLLLYIILQKMLLIAQSRQEQILAPVLCKKCYDLDTRQFGYEPR